MKQLTKPTLILPIILYLLLPIHAVAQTWQDTIKQIDALFEQFGPNTPGASLTVSRRGQVVYHKHFGMADLEHGIPVTDSTIFEAGSVSKQFAATAVLMLINEGLVGMDDNVRKYIPELPEYEHRITVRHLLNHTSGLKDWGVLAGLGGWPRGNRVYTNTLALNYIIRQPTLNNEPGAEYLYSNSNYTLLTFIAERVSGQSLPEFTRERIFVPLGMTATQWRDDYTRVVRGRAIGYETHRGTYRIRMPFENTYGHAALLTTTTDLNKWNTSWKESPLGGEAILNLRTERGVLNNGDTIRYAGGVRIDRHNGFLSVNHSGATAGYRAWLSYFPEEELSICFLSNDAGVPTSGIGHGVASIFLGPISSAPATSDKPVERPLRYTLRPGDLRGIDGKYVSTECGGETTVAVKGDTVWMSNNAGATWSVSPVAADSFSHGLQTAYAFQRDENGHVTGFFVSVPRARNVWFRKASYSKAEELERLFSYLSTNGMFNGGVAIVDQGNLIFKRGYGIGNFETGSDFTGSSQTEIASVSKQFTASAIMLLRERGLLNLDDDINKYFIPPLPFQGITIKHLLTHTSGLPEYEDYFTKNWKTKVAATNKDIVGFLHREKPAALDTPGRIYRYSNLGYVLLAEIVEAIAGTPLDRFLEENLFAPAGMASTGFFSRDSIFTMPNYAPGVQWDDNQGRYVRPETISGQAYVRSLSERLGPGRLSSTVDDLIRWDSLLYSYSVLPAALQNEMYAPHVRTPDGAHYGFGWQVTHDPIKGRVVHHSGSWPGNLTYIRRYLDDRSTMILLNNTSSPYMSAIRKVLVRLLAGQSYAYPEPKAADRPSQ